MESDKSSENKNKNSIDGTAHLVNFTLKESYEWLNNANTEVSLHLDELCNWILVAKETDPLEDDPSEDDPSEDDPSEDDPLKKDSLENDPLKKDSLENDPLKKDSLKNVPSEDVSLKNEYKFCNTMLLERLQIGSCFLVNWAEWEEGRTRCYPFEKIDKLYFCSRAALKMANIDSLFQLQNPVDHQNCSLLEGDELFYIADVGGNTGGFIDYLLWRKGWQTKCFGITPKWSRDGTSYTFHKFASSFEMINTYYGSEGNGDINDPKTNESFIKYVHERVPNNGVHLVIADGTVGIRKWIFIEKTQLLVSSSLMGLALLRPSGSFVLKMFDTFTLFSVGIIYIMYRCFRRICLIKPNMSRPVGTERFLICQWKMANTDDVVPHLIELNKTMERLKASGTYLAEIVSPEVMYSDKKFTEYIKQFNDSLITDQITFLKKLFMYRKNIDLFDPRMEDIKEQCLKQWNIPPSIDQIAPGELFPTVEMLREHLIQLGYADWDFSKMPSMLTKSKYELGTVFAHPSEWRCIRLSERTPTYFASLGACRVFMYNLEQELWELVPNDMHVVMPHSTLVYGQMVDEYTMSSGREMSFYALHIIDGICVGGTDLFNLPLPERLRLCAKFADAINNPFTKIADRRLFYRKRADIRLKGLLKYEDLVPFLKCCNLNDHFDGWLLSLFQAKLEPKKKYKFGGILFLKYNEFDDFNQTFSELICWRWDTNFKSIFDINKNAIQSSCGTDENVYVKDFVELAKTWSDGVQN